MLAVDTIVIVRLITADDPVQFRQARALFDQHEILLLKTVLLESDWVLRSVYRYDRRRVIDAFAKLVALPRVECDELATVTGAIEWRRAGMDFADALHLASARRAQGLATFDCDLVALAEQVAGVAAIKA